MNMQATEYLLYLEAVEMQFVMARAAFLKWKVLDLRYREAQL
jgi:hypothetical protein